MRRLIQVLLFVVIYLVLFNVMKWLFNHVDLGLTLQQLSMLELFLMGVLFFATLITTGVLSRYLKA